jgi:2-epi-5-epi-valiolone synthase
LTSTQPHRTPDPFRDGRSERMFEVSCRQERRYEVHMVDDVFAVDSRLAPLLAKRKTLAVTTPTVWSIYGQRLEALRSALGADLAVFVLEAGEGRKSMDMVLRICELCHEHELGRTDSLLSLGGGVCHDLVTVAASLVRRGIPHVSVPTTLVGQIDAGVGVKGAVNFRGSKSYLGCFAPPAKVLVDPAFLQTAPARTRTDGVAEIVKIGLIADANLIHLLQEPNSLLSCETPSTNRTQMVLWLAIRRILEQLSTNLFEDQTYQRLVDFGHTFSGQVEELSGYEISHGCAVAIDMALSAAISLTLGSLSNTGFQRILTLLKECSLPIYSPLLTVASCQGALRSAARHRGGHPNLVIPHRLGSGGFVTDLAILSDDVLADSIARVRTP